MKKVLFTSVCSPLGPKHGDGESVGYELLFGQVTRAQGVFSPRATHKHFALEYISANIDAPATVLQFPSKRQLVGELRKGYDYVCVSFILATAHRMKEVVALVREHSPKAKIVLGGYGTVMSDSELKPYGDFICREEGVAFMRRLLGEAPKEMPYEHPLIVSRLKVFSLPASKTGMVFAGLGCANGCDFCCTSHFFKRRHIRLLPTGRDIYGVIERYLELDPDMAFTILDEDFLLNKKRAMEFRDCVLEGGRPLSLFAFASIRALSQYTMKELLEMGVDGVWVGYEGTRSGYSKQQGRPVSELFPDLFRHGIMTLASMIVGFDYQDRQVVSEELRGLLRLRPTLTQFLIYGPTPGTPFYERVQSEGRLREDAAADRDKYYHSCTGFNALVRHPKLAAAQIEGLQRWCFEQDFHKLGPAIYRSIRVWLSGYATLKNSPHLFLRRKALRYAADARRAMPLFLAGKLFAPNARVRRWMGALERRMHRDLGAPTLLEQALSWVTLGAALWTKFTLRFDLFQHPRLSPQRYRWDYLSEMLMRFFGEKREGASVAELQAYLQREGAQLRLRLEGAMDGKNARELGRRMREALLARRERMTIHMEKLQHMDRKGLAAFYRVFRAHKSRVRLVLPQGPLGAVPAIRRLARWFTPVPETA